jgi:hypothetical protein
MNANKLKRFALSPLFFSPAYVETNKLVSLEKYLLFPEIIHEMERAEKIKRRREK